MKKGILFFTALLCSVITHAQFTILHPGIAVQTIEDIKVGDSHRMLFATDNGLLIYNSITWSHFDTTTGMGGQHAVAIDAYSGGFYYSTTNHKIGHCDYSTVTDSIFRYAPAYPFDYISAIYAPPGSDTIVMGTNNGLILVKASPPEYLLNPGGTNTGYVVAINHLEDAAGTVNYEFAATTDSQGIVNLSPLGLGPVIRSLYPFIPSDVVLSSTTEGANCYNGTDKGLYVLNFTSASFTMTDTINMNNSPLPTDSITAVQVSGDTMFIGTPQGLALRMGGTWTIYNTSNSNIPSSRITKLALDSNTLYIGTAEGDICILSFRGNTGVKSAATQQPLIYPNPCNDVLHIKVTGAQHCWAMYDMTGREVSTGELQGNGDIDVHALAAGTYVLELGDENGEKQKATIEVVR